MDEFITVWNNLQTCLKPGTEIENWNTYHGYLGEDLTINKVDPNYISIDPPRVLDTQVVPKEGFEKIWNVWGGLQSTSFEAQRITGNDKFFQVHHQHISLVRNRAAKQQLEQSDLLLSIGKVDSA